MAITSEIIGKLGGGAGVEETPVSTPRGTGNLALKTVTVPPGKTVLVAVKGKLSRSADVALMPTILAAGVEIGAGIPGTTTISGASTLTASSSIAIKIIDASATSFSGTVYTVEM